MRSLCFYAASITTLLFALLKTAPAEPPPFSLFNASSYEELVNESSAVNNDPDASNPSSDKSQPLLADYFGGEPGFYHGVASGDPLHDSVIVWTRYTPVNADEEVTIELRMAPVDDDESDTDSLLDPDVNANLKRANVLVTAQHDWIAKIDVTNLPSNKEFVFAFVEGDHVSDVGTTRTAPALDQEMEAMIYAVFSCAHFSNGYFHAYDVASTIKDLDFWVHVGDYLYEYSPDFESYASDSPERKAKILPRWETIELQDYRLRHHTYLQDEGLRNLRRRAPMIATWDDHDTADNSYGQGNDVSNSGAENHQEKCPVGESAPRFVKDKANCDRDEGDVGVRWNAALQAYLEWLPLRKGPGSMGVVEDASLTQIIEWGDLASLVVFDTRISHRSREPTEDSHFIPFAILAATNLNVTKYSESPLKEQFAAIAESVNEDIYNPSYTMIGDNINILRDVFQASKDAGKTWQIWGGATMMGPQLAVNFDRAHEWVKNPTKAQAVKTYMRTLLELPITLVPRLLVAMDQNKIPWNPDDFNGFGVERAAILDVAKQNANNPIILGGDLHDSFAWTLYEGGDFTGEPVAVNLGITGVTSPGFAHTLWPFLSLLQGVLGTDGVYDLINAMYEGQNEGNVYSETQYKGFYAVKATKQTHTTEFFYVTPENILTNYEDARAASGGITVDYFCGKSLVTTAGEPGSLAAQDECSAIEFDDSRPALWDTPVPTGKAQLTSSSLADCGKDGCSTELETSTVKPGDDQTSGTQVTSAGARTSSVLRFVAVLPLLVLIQLS